MTKLTETPVEQPVNITGDTKAAALPEIATVSAIKAGQDQIKVNLASLDVQVHANAVQCLMHAAKHGDTSLMTRLLVDTLGDKSGYRRQGLIVWMRRFSPMELAGKTINLSGIVNGERKPFLLEEANETPFWNLATARETTAEPIFRDNLVKAMERAVKTYRDAVNNTIVTPGAGAAAIDTSKPYYDGVQLDVVEDTFAKIEGLIATLNGFADGTKDVYTARRNLAKAEAAA